MTAAPVRRPGPLILGVVAALAGHAVSVAAAYGAGWMVGGGASADDLEAGGAFAVAVAGMFTLVLTQIFLLAIAVPLGVVALRRHQMMGIGVLAGWTTGFLVLATLVVWLLVTASQV